MNNDKNSSRVLSAWIDSLFGRPSGTRARGQKKEKPSAQFDDRCRAAALAALAARRQQELSLDRACAACGNRDESSVNKQTPFAAIQEFNRGVAAVLDAQHASVHLHAFKMGKPALVAPGRTISGCITEEPLVAPMEEEGRITVRLFRELLPRLEDGSRAAIYDRASLRVAGKRASFCRTVYGAPFRNLLAGLIETEGRPIGVVKVENKLHGPDRQFNDHDRSTLLCFIRQFSPSFQKAHEWVQKRAWAEIDIFPPGRKSG